MTPARPPCPVCGAPVALQIKTPSGTPYVPLHKPAPGTAPDRHGNCPGTGALAPAGDLLGAPLAVEAPPEPRPLAPHAPAFQLDAFKLDLFGGPQS